MCFDSIINFGPNMIDYARCSWEKHFFQVACVLLMFERRILSSNLFLQNSVSEETTHIFGFGRSEI